MSIEEIAFLSMMLTDIFVCKLVRQAYPLRLMLHGLSVYNGMFELLHDCLMDGIALNTLVGVKADHSSDLQSLQRYRHSS